MSEKTPWRKNLDKRYISGEDLIMGESMNKGLKREMVVTLMKYEDSPAFDQKLQKETDKTAIWLKDHFTGQMLYKPMLLNVINGEFLAKEIGGNSLFIDDFSTTIPFVIYACPDRRHGHVVRCKKYVPIAKKALNDVDFQRALDNKYPAEKLKSEFLLTPEQLAKL
jgi:hypothetical protein